MILPRVARQAEMPACSNWGLLPLSQSIWVVWYPLLSQVWIRDSFRQGHGKIRKERGFIENNGLILSQDVNANELWKPSVWKVQIYKQMSIFRAAYGTLHKSNKAHKKCILSSTAALSRQWTYSWHQERQEIAHQSTLLEQGISVRTPITLLSRLKSQQKSRQAISRLPAGQIGSLDRVRAVFRASCQRLSKYACRILKLKQTG